MIETVVMEASGAGDAPDADADAFDAPVRLAPVADIDALIVNLDGYEGPLDLLLELARAQKVDLRKISMLALVEQYLAFIEAAKTRDLELAADYLVMAAWLAYLKSRLLLPAPEEGGEEPTADELAARLAFQLMRLEAMRKAAEALLDLPRLG
ncbi:MAG TPA: ScpA family protein, partial [Parvularculaceae bacterium]|nr:ScpA family protein [Parvularculaceae bacterium]